MTINEALEQLIDLNNSTSNSLMKEDYEAIEYGIKALKWFKNMKAALESILPLLRD